MGLLGVIRMTNPDLNQLALGTDLTSMGLNLNANGTLYSKFGSPWSEAPAPTSVPGFKIPPCYEMPAPALKGSHLKKFHNHSLFYMFFSMPRDILQAYAAKELHSRGWRFNKDLRLWFFQEVNVQTKEKQLVYFDANSWDVRIFNGSIANTSFMDDFEMNFESPSQSQRSGTTGAGAGAGGAGLGGTGKGPNTGLAPGGEAGGPGGPGAVSSLG